jgi:APA family basic amino acid/polyamine antiporter
VVLRIREPGRLRVFRTPLWWAVGPLGIAGCLYLFSSLPSLTIGLFFLWNGLGVVLYLLFARRSSLLAKAPP